MAGKTKPKLKDIHRMFVVQRMACYDTPKEAAEALKEEFGIQISPQAAQFYDPTKLQGSRQLAKKWKELFWQIREEFNKKVELYIPGANRSVRLKFLWDAVLKFKKAGNYIAMGDMLERIAKERGRMYSNTRKFEHTGKDGGAIEFRDVDMMSQEEVENELRSYGIDPDAIVVDGPATTQ